MTDELQVYPCPYTGRNCFVWDCDDCEIESEEQRWMKELNDEEEREFKGRIDEK